MNTLSDRLIAARRFAGFTQREAAGFSGVSRTTIANLESGGSENPSLGTLDALSRAYGTTVYALLKPHEDDATGSSDVSPENDRAPVPTAATR